MSFSELKSESSVDYELFRRAICQRDDAAWAAIIDRYKRTVAAWVRQRPARVDHDAVDGVVNRAFERFWFAVSPERFDAFPSLAALLGYLKACAGTAMLDEVRTARRRPTVSLDQLLGSSTAYGEPAATDDPEAEVAGSLGAEQVWSIIERILPDRVDRAVVYLSFEAGLAPASIHQRYPAVFPSVDAVYDRKARILTRLRKRFVVEWRARRMHDGACTDERPAPKNCRRAGELEVCAHTGVPPRRSTTPGATEPGRCAGKRAGKEEATRTSRSTNRKHTHAKGLHQHMTTAEAMSAAQLTLLYAVIGRTIVEGIPYEGMKLGVEARTGINPERPDEPGLYPVPERRGPAQDHAQGGTELPDDKLEKIVNEPSTCDWWYYDGAPRRIIKSMKLPYYWQYEGKDKADFILVGYVGWEPPG